MELSLAIKSHLKDYDMFKNISYDDIKHSYKNQLISFTKTEYKNKHYYTRKLNNSLFSELIIMFDEDIKQTSLTYTIQLTDELKNNLQPLFQELYKLANREFSEFENEAEFIFEQKIIWAYSLENNKISLGV